MARNAARPELPRATGILAAIAPKWRPILVPEAPGLVADPARTFGARRRAFLARRAERQLLKAHPFAHGAWHPLNGAASFDSYYCSRHNVNTGVLTQAKFDGVIGRIAAELRG